MQIESLQVFCDVARQRSFSQAARDNNLTQSAVSQIVHQLERRLGDVQLIDRATRPPQLTALGKSYYEGCRVFLQQYLELEAAIRQSQEQLVATVRVAAIYSVGLRDMSQYVTRFEAQPPRTKVHIEYLHPDEVHGQVLEGTADFGLVSFPRKSRELTTLPWREEEMVLTCSPHHPLAQNRVVEPQHLTGAKYVGFAKGLVIRREVERFLREHEVAVQVVHEFDSIENIKKAIDDFAAVALLPEPTVRREVQAGTLVARPLAGWHMVRPLGVIHRRHGKLSSSAQRFLDLLRQPDENGTHGPGLNGSVHGAESAARRKEAPRQHNGTAASKRKKV
jgi:DNA-binding transcriptional LysR family regulator